MKTTLNIDDAVMQRLREEATRSGRSMSELVETGLRRFLAKSAPDQTPDELPPLPEWASGGARLDVADRDALATIIDDD
jgi:hypothetical protein